jgi:hypothetical protein
MGEAPIAGAAANLHPRSVRILVGHDERSFQPRIERVPMVELELIGGERQGRAEFVVLLALPGRRQWIHHAIFDSVEIKVLRAHELVVARRSLLLALRSTCLTSIFTAHPPLVAGRPLYFDLYIGSFAESLPEANFKLTSPSSLRQAHFAKLTSPSPFRGLAAKSLAP